MERLFRSKNELLELHPNPGEGHGFDVPAPRDSAPRVIAVFGARLTRDR